MKYGIEQYYVEQGQGKEMEKIRGSRTGFQLPMLIHAAVSDGGTAVIQSFSWAKIATKTEVLRSPERNAKPEAASAIMRFTLKNVSDTPISLPWRSNDCAFALQPTKPMPETLERLGFDRPGCANARKETRTLAPDQAISIDFDLNQPQWVVRFPKEADKPTPLGKLPWEYRFRIVYWDKAVEGVSGSIISRAFHGRGNVD